MDNDNKFLYSVLAGVTILSIIVFTFNFSFEVANSIPPTDAIKTIVVGSENVTADSYHQLISFNFTGLTIDANNTTKEITFTATSGTTLSDDYCTGGEVFYAYNATLNDFLCIAGGGGAVYENNTASNVGTGVGVFQTKSGVDLRFHSLLNGGGTTITDVGNEIEIDTSFRANTVDINCSDTEQLNRLQYDNSTGTFTGTCETDETGGGSSRVTLTTTVNCTSTGATYCTIFTIPLTANSRHSIDFDLISQTSGTTIGIQFRGASTQATTVGMCSFVSVSSATAFLFDNIAISTNPADTGDTAELTANPQPDRIYCVATTGATAGNLLLQFQSETGGNVSVLDGSNYRLIVES